MKKILLVLSFLLSHVILAQSDCVSAFPVCGNSTISYTPSGSGNDQEDLQGCLTTDEHFSVWYSFTIAQSGTLEFTIDPVTFQDDYDFAVYGPNTPCSNLGLPIRCNYSGLDGPTGLGNNANDPNGANTNGVSAVWSSTLNVVAGETYYLVVDNYLSSADGFSLTWGGTAVLTSPFSNNTIKPFPFVQPGPNADGNIPICVSPSPFNFSTLTPGILNGNPATFTVTYHSNSNDALTGSNPLIGVQNVVTGVKYYYSIKYTDPNNAGNPLNNCREVGEINFVLGNIVVNNTSLSACNNNNTGIGLFDLTTAIPFMYPGTTNSVKYYPSQADLNAGTNEITNPTNYSSSVPKSVYVKVTTQQNCSSSGIITLQLKPLVVLTNATLTECFIEGAQTTATFNLSEAAVTTNAAYIKRYYLTLQDAINNTNELQNTTNYTSTAKDVFVRVTNEEGCWNTAKITLKVTPPTYSTVLKDVQICAEGRTILNAGSGFDSYLWSTGATTSSINNVTIGEYWVDLGKNGCITRQTVKVYPFAKPVIKNVDVSNNTATITAEGGNAPYQYSLDGMNWQGSNVFSNLPRGENQFFVKDVNNCLPVMVTLTVPNLINAITPNGDGNNDYIEYSGLAYKKDLVFTIYNRYGNKLHTADSTRGYLWDGRSGGKKVNTGTYWYVVTWTEPTTNVPVKYSGWILVKN